MQRPFISNIDLSILMHLILNTGFIWFPNFYTHTKIRVIKNIEHF